MSKKENRATLRMERNPKRGLCQVLQQERHKKICTKCDIVLSKELQLQYRDEIMMEYKESLVVVRKRFDCRGFIHRLIKKSEFKKTEKEYLMAA